MNRRLMIAVAAVALCLIPAGLALSQPPHRHPRPNPVVALARAWAADHHMPLHPPASSQHHFHSLHIRRADGGTIGPDMTTVTSAQLQAGGIVLSAPYTDSPAQSASQADATAIGFEEPDIQWIVRETVLADYTGGVPPGTVNRLVWVVSLEASGGRIPNYFTGGAYVQGLSPEQYRTPTPHYLIVLVDATTGAVLFDQEG